MYIREDLCDKFMDENAYFYKNKIKNNYCIYIQYYKD